MEVQCGISNNSIINYFTKQTNERFVQKHFYGTGQRAYTEKGTKNIYIKATKKDSTQKCNRENKNKLAIN